MRKANIVILLISFSAFLFAGIGGYINKSVSEDPINNRLYIGINEISTSRFSEKEKIKYDIINYMIFDPVSGEKTFIFPESNEKVISTMLFEIEFDTSDNRMVLNGDMNYSDYKYYAPNFIINNFDLTKREPRNKIVFLLSHGFNKPQELWICTKEGTSLEMLTKVDSKESWHLDIKNQKIRVITQAGINTTVKEYDW